MNRPSSNVPGLPRSIGTAVDPVFALVGALARTAAREDHTRAGGSVGLPGEDRARFGDQIRR
jgi:hypothetical protein